MSTPSDMTGEGALVTGAAGGLGRATALALAKAGADVCIVDINAAGLEETAEQVRALGRKALVHATNLATADNCRAAVAAAVGAYGRLDALCNVAGVIVFSHTPEMSDADWERTLAINLSAPFFLCRAAIPQLLEHKGAIVNVSSTAAFLGEAYVAAYCASKGGLHQLTKSLAMEYIHTPLRINSVAPGGMATPMGATIRMPEGVDYALIKRYSPVRSLVEIDDVAGMIAFLASDAARSIHGACITVDAGITAG